MNEALPKQVEQFRKRNPKIWQKFNELDDLCHDAGPLDQKTRRLVRLALSIGSGLEEVRIRPCAVLVPPA
jgi:alkylhydroperoxidase/carboxymuconolactone decarboxylase family protein YurZ